MAVAGPGADTDNTGRAWHGEGTHGEKAHADGAQHAPEQTDARGCVGGLLEAAAGESQTPRHGMQSPWPPISIKTVSIDEELGGRKPWFCLRAGAQRGRPR